MATIVRRKRRREAPDYVTEEDAVYDPPGRPTSTHRAERPTTLPAVYRRSQERRRLDFLEVAAWAFYRLESCDEAELQRFSEELQAFREQEWGTRPWAGAKDPEGFIRHVTAMAEDFTTNPVRFRNRKRQPNPAV